eukprot:TRINITY_DN2461_c0_g1_i3.p1 TRINITY_DN2461_c0_g1~~TRINITY_DN2461_c0_g1_i3.p1  ORF type:complete len:444 (+),score=47.00 TRINITY_DN2461_c0_g1_i3:102-1433(+)
MKKGTWPTVHPHKLEIIDDATRIVKECESCQEQLASRYWKCFTCEIGLCQTCLPFLQLAAKTPRNTLEAHKHPLQKINPVYGVGEWVCDICESQFSTTKKSWHCDTCDYDLCDSCKQISTQKRFNSFLSLKEAYKSELKFVLTSSVANVIINYLNPGKLKILPTLLGIGNLVDVKTSNGGWKSGRVGGFWITAEDGWIGCVNIEAQISGWLRNTTKLSPVFFPVDSEYISLYQSKNRPARRRIPGALMLLPVSGRVGFQPMIVNPLIDKPLYELWLKLARQAKLPEQDEKDKFDDENVKRTFLMALVRREAELRLSEEAQHGMDKYHEDGAKVFEVTEKMQLKALREFGFQGTENETMGLRLLRSASNLYPDEPQIKETFYVKYNRAASGTLQVGDVCPDVPLFNAKGKKTNLFEAYRQLVCGMESKQSAHEPPLVLIAGSAS